MILVVIGGVAIGFAGIQKNRAIPNEIPINPADGVLYQPEIRDPKSPTWLAILWGVITPCFFLAQSFFTKFITQPKYNFDARTASFGTSSVTSFLVLILGVAWFWRSVQPFDSWLFGIGILGSIFDTVGKSFIQMAFANGPAGPVAGLVEINNVLLVVVEGFRLWKFPTLLEIIGFIFAISGGMAFVFPNQINKLKKCLLISFCCCLK